MLSEARLGTLHDLCHGFKYPLVVQCAQGHTLAPAHLLQHVAPLVLLAKLGD